MPWPAAAYAERTEALRVHEEKDMHDNHFLMHNHIAKLMSCCQLATL